MKILLNWHVETILLLCSHAKFLMKARVLKTTLLSPSLFLPHIVPLAGDWCLSKSTPILTMLLKTRLESMQSTACRQWRGFPTQSCLVQWQLLTLLRGQTNKWTEKTIPSAVHHLSAPLRACSVQVDCENKLLVVLQVDIGWCKSRISIAY